MGGEGPFPALWWLSSRPKKWSALGAFSSPPPHTLACPRDGLGEQHWFAGKIQSRLFQALVCVLKQLNLSVHYQGHQCWAPGSTVLFTPQPHVPGT